MSSKKYQYDINYIAEKRNQRDDDGGNLKYSVRAIAKSRGWCPVNTQGWINRNYIEVIRYDYIKRPNSNGI